MTAHTHRPPPAPRTCSTGTPQGTACGAVAPYYAAGSVTLYRGDCRTVLAALPAESVQCVVTSPPYFGLRDYGTAQWDGGDPACDHMRIYETPRTERETETGRNAFGGPSDEAKDASRARFRDVCGKCGARRVDAQIGLEQTPAAYVAEMVSVFREVRRVLRDDGVVWLNLGDSYATQRNDNDWLGSGASAIKGKFVPPGYKPKDLLGIPWAVAKALQEPYYTGRIARERDRVWLAATLDAEGTICGFSHERKDDGRTRTGVHITITNASTVMLDEAHRIWPASRSEHERPGDGHIGLQQTWRWIVHGIENKVQFLREIYPYLIVKRRQAVLAYNLLLLMRDAKSLGHTIQRDLVREKRALLVRLLSEANHGGCEMPSWCVEPPSVYEPGWYLRSDCIWAKPNPMPESVTDRPTRSHEYIFLLTKNARYWYDADAIKEPLLSTPDEYLRAGASVRANHAFGAVAGRPLGRGSFATMPDGRNKRDVWTVATQPYPDAHFATFPTKLIEPCILAGCPVGGVVLDPFAGAGTTLMVAQRFGRKSVGIELNAAYCDLAIRRLGQEALPLETAVAQ